MLGDLARLAACEAFLSGEACSFSCDLSTPACSCSEAPLPISGFGWRLCLFLLRRFVSNLSTVDLSSLRLRGNTAMGSPPSSSSSVSPARWADRNERQIIVVRFLSCHLFG